MTPLPLTEDVRIAIRAFLDCDDAGLSLRLNDSGVEDVPFLAAVIEASDPSSRVDLIQKRLTTMQRLSEIEDIRDDLTDEKRRLTR